MQALERIYNTHNWITIVLVFLFLTIFLMKVIDPKKLKGYALSVFSKNFIEDETEEDTSFFNSFQIVISLFSGIVLSVVLYFLIIHYSSNTATGFFTFFMIFISVFLYFIVKWSLEYALSIVFQIKKSVRFFVVSKFSYLYSISFLLFFGIVLVEYSQLNTHFLLYLSIVLFLFRFVLHFFNNKKLIFNKLFYFILYFCAFEIAPLLILFKLMF